MAGESSNHKPEPQHPAQAVCLHASVLQARKARVMLNQLKVVLCQMATCQTGHQQQQRQQQLLQDQGQLRGVSMCASHVRALG